MLGAIDQRHVDVFKVFDRRVVNDRSGIDELTIEVDVLNEGPASGQATVFLFARDVVASVARPVLELKGVAKIALAPGEGGTVFPGNDLKPVLEPGEFLLLAGQSADPRQMLTIKVRAQPG
jgi:beta-glucosidase